MEVTSSKSKTHILRKLKAILPEAFYNGKLELEKLKLLLGGDFLYEEEQFELTWPGKSAAEELINSFCNCTLIPYPEDSINWDATENIFIEGENLDALKILQENYYGKIKTIYIDPPYNTRNNGFTYGDKFSVTSREYLSRHGRRNGKLNSNSTRGLIPENNNGHFHANWLSMMYPRLILAR